MDTIQELEKMLKEHDWYYMMSDNHDVWRKGNKHLEKIRELMAIAAVEGTGEQAKELYNKYAPNW